MKLLKKTISVILATAMFVPSILSAAAVDNTPIEKKYSAIQTSYVNEKEERVSNIDYNVESVYKSSGVALPSAYNSADYGYVTSVKNQGETGTCWAHAAAAACESSMIINNGYDRSLDLSELHLAYAVSHTQKDKMGMFYDYNYQSTHRYLDAGNNAVITLANQIGVVKESANHSQFSSEKLHYDYPETFDVYNPEALYAYNEACLLNAYKISVSNRDLLKEYIVKYGAGEMTVNADCFNDKLGTFYSYNDVGTKHAVVVVGWDDNYPKENCTFDGYTPQNNGAWLIKNSWGVNSGIDGYMWVSYEDNFITKSPVIFYEMTSSDTYTNTYQYDDLCQECFLCDENGNYSFVGGAYMANMFTAVKDNETLEAVSFYTSNEKLDYTVNIYTDIDNITDPTKGTLKATISGEDLIMGYHTIKLNEPVVLEKGEKFSVVVNLKDNQNPEAEVYVNIDADDYVESTRKISEYGESFFSSDGENWDDVKYTIESNMRIKAFTNSDETPMELNDYYDFYNGKSRDELLSTLKSTLDYYVNLEVGDYQYSKESLEKLRNACTYAEQVCNNPDLFLAIEFFGLNQKLNTVYSQLKPYNIDDIIIIYNNYIINNIVGYYSYPQWKEYLNICNSIREEANNVTLTYDQVLKYKSQIEQACMNFMTDIINKGAYDSYLQNFGDVDKSGEINIKDATYVQMSIGDFMMSTYVDRKASDVDGDGEINIKDATILQEYVAKLKNYFPIYDMQFADEEVDKNIDFDTAVKNLENAVSTAESEFAFDGFNAKVPVGDIVRYCLVNDAKKVLENPQDYYPNVIDFKARNLNSKLI